jgi:hypothetical protein
MSGPFPLFLLHVLMLLTGTTLSFISSYLCSERKRTRGTSCIDREKEEVRAEIKISTQQLTDRVHVQHELFEADVKLASIGSSIIYCVAASCSEICRHH